MSDYVLKVQEHAFRRAEELAGVLGISEVAAFGHLAYLWRWVLTLRPDSAPDGIVLGRASCLRLEAAARWRGKRGAFVDALVELDLVTRERRKLRVKGTKPYADEWKQKDAARARERERRRAKREATKKAEKPSKLAVVTRLLPPSEEAMRWWSWAMERRSRDRFKKDYDPFSPGAIERKGTPADAAPPKSFAQWFESRVVEGTSPDSLAVAWLRYLGDEHFESREWPLPVFMADGVFRPRLAQTA